MSWRIVPTLLREMLQSTNAAKSARAMKATMQMIKLDIAALQKAYDGKLEARGAPFAPSPVRGEGAHPIDRAGGVGRQVRGKVASPCSPRRRSSVFQDR